jgi:hypothetical protein
LQNNATDTTVPTSIAIGPTRVAVRGVVQQPVDRLTAAQPHVHEHHAEPGTDPVRDDEQERLVIVTRVVQPEVRDDQTEDADQRGHRTLECQWQHHALVTNGVESK